MSKKGKRSISNEDGIDFEKNHDLTEAVAIIKSKANAKFDETIELVLRLGIDPRKAEEMVRGTVALPAGTGRDVRVAVFAQGEPASLAREAGADIVGDADLAEEIEKGMLDFDIVIATPDMMPVVGKLGRTLGPRGLMPNPKTGTVTDNVVKAIEEFKGGMVEYRTDKFGNVQIPIGKASFEESSLLENLNAVLEEIHRAKPSGAKGKYIKKAVISSTMGPGVKKNTSDLL